MAWLYLIIASFGEIFGVMSINLYFIYGINRLAGSLLLLEPLVVDLYFFLWRCERFH